MFSLFKCKHKHVVTKFSRVPRFDTEVLISYSYCERCKKLLTCKVVLVPKTAKITPVSAPVVQEPQELPLKPPALVVKQPIAPLIQEKAVIIPPKIEKPPVEVKNTLIKSKRNVGRKPSAPVLPEGAKLSTILKTVYSAESSESIKFNHIDSTKEELDETYKQFEDIDDLDEDEEKIETVRKESSEEAKRRFQRAKRKEQRKI